MDTRTLSEAFADWRKLGGSSDVEIDCVLQDRFNAAKRVFELAVQNLGFRRLLSFALSSNTLTALIHDAAMAGPD